MNKSMRQQAVMFYALLAIFVASAVVALLAIADKLHMPENYRRALFAAVIVETATALFAYWRQLTAKEFGDPPDVNGDDWHYECIRADETYKHGGTCSIRVRAAETGWEFTISGQRHWKADLVNGEWIRREFQAIYTWDNSWGTFTGCDALRYGYSVKLAEHSVEGYGSAVIKKNKEGRTVLMEGNFYQLPPHDAFYGFQRYFR